jgi:hypothetical protein
MRHASSNKQALELGLQDFAVGIAWQHLAGEENSDRHLEGRDTFGGKGAQFLLARLRAVFEGDDRARLFAQRTVRDGDDGAAGCS